MAAEPLIALQDLCGHSARLLLERLIAAPRQIERVALMSAYLRERAQRAAPIHLSAEHAVALLEAARGAISVETIARRCGVTTRTLRNVLVSETGLSPKQLGRIVRVRYSLMMLQQVGELGINGNSSFSDRAHLCREFRSLLGTTPTVLGRHLKSAHSLPVFTSDRDLLGTGLLIRSALSDGSPPSADGTS